MTELPPGQRKIPTFVIYRILGQPEVDISKWRFVISGLVEKEVSFTYDELKEMADMEYTSDFHCVTGWTVENVRWRGVSLRKLISMAKPKPDVEWGYVTCVDGYTTVIPYTDLISEKSILVLEMNGEPLTPEQGYPARIFIPHLYGWKSAKWVWKVELIDRYVDGYWEALGYHERGNVWRDERFKGYR